MWTDYEHYTSSPRNPIPHISDFSRWLCHPRNKQKSPVGAQGLGWQFPLCRDLSPKSQVHIIQQNFSSILIAYVLSDVKCCGCSTVLSSSLLFTSIIVQRLKDFVIWSVIAIIAQAGHKKRRKKDSLDADNGSQIPQRMWNITNRKCESDLLNLRTKNWHSGGDGWMPEPKYKQASDAP